MCFSIYQPHQSREVPVHAFWCWKLWFRYVRVTYCAVVGWGFEDLLILWWFSSCHFIFPSGSAVTIIHSRPLKLQAHGGDTVWLKHWHFTKTFALYIHSSPSRPGRVTSRCLRERSPFRTAFKNKPHFTNWTHSYVRITTGWSLWFQRCIYC